MIKFKLIKQVIPVCSLVIVCLYLVLQLPIQRHEHRVLLSDSHDLDYKISREAFNYQKFLGNENSNELFEKTNKSQIKLCWSSPRRKVTSVSCVGLMEGDEVEITKAQKISLEHRMDTTPSYHSIFQLTSLLNNCSFFKRSMEYDAISKCLVTKEELDFPIAYSILVHDDAPQFERLLRAIYRPHNLYCIHVDKKSSPAMTRVLEVLANCFDNVFVTDKRENVVYAHFSRLQADLNCMGDLLRRNDSWKYLINLTGQMYPLKTNREIVKILSTLRGTNDIEGFSWYKSKVFAIRYKNIYEIREGKLKKTSVAKKPPPLNITIIKGSVFGSFSRDFVEYILANDKVRIFLEWLKDTYSPDEFFWASVNSRYINPMFHTPGGYDGAPERMPWLSTFAAWEGKDPCKGKSVRTICIFGVGDLQYLVSRLEMFANKFHSNYHPLVIDCLEEWLYNRTVSPQPFPVYTYKEKRYYVDPTNT